MVSCRGCPARTSTDCSTVQNLAARLLTRTMPWAHITPILNKLHWLCIKQRITYKILLLTYKSLHSRAPQYITTLLQPYSQSPRSTGKDLLSIPRTRLQTYGDRAFCSTASTLRNNLPPRIHSAPPSLTLFKKHTSSP